MMINAVKYFMDKLGFGDIRLGLDLGIKQIVFWIISCILGRWFEGIGTIFGIVC